MFVCVRMCVHVHVSASLCFYVDGSGGGMHHPISAESVIALNIFNSKGALGAWEVLLVGQ